MLLHECNIPKSLIMVISDNGKQKIIGNSKSTLRRYKNAQVLKIDPAPSLLNDGTIDYVIFIKPVKSK